MDSALILSLLILPFASIGLGVVAILLQRYETARSQRRDADTADRHERDRAHGLCPSETPTARDLNGP